ncbi:MAG: IS1634 family transposase, partial [Prevotellaceae bacterium]|nr:IS1634 family transposase [Prevotellaceae bacterium]
MFFKTTFRVNPSTNQTGIYYRLVENYRNVLGDTRQRNILTVGFMEDITPSELHRIADGLNDKINGQSVLYNPNEKVSGYIERLYSRLVSEKRIDVLLDVQKKYKEGDWQTINVDSIKTEDVRELGAEWLSLQTLRKLQIEEYLSGKGWNKRDTDLAMAHIISRAVYPASEHRTVRFMQENSSVCELLGIDANKVSKDRLYRISLKLYSEKEGLENYLSHKTNELFDIQDKIILYDLTNTYFEGEKRSSKLSKRGRSKEKRSDCPLLVLAMVVNVEGFIKYSVIYEGNKSDSSTLCDMIEKLRLSTSSASKKAIVVIDAGISTKDNLEKIVSKGYEYVCVSRSNLTKYSEVQGSSPKKVKDRRGREIELLHVESADSEDSEYYLKVSSPVKALKEASMYKQFHERFREGLESIS